MVEFRRVALTEDQVREYDLPTAPPKGGKDNPHGKNWEGGTCQLEALPPDTLTTVLREALDAVVNPDVVRDHEEREVREREQIVEVLNDI